MKRIDHRGNQAKTVLAIQGKNSELYYHKPSLIIIAMLNVSFLSKVGWCEL
jgi:hypothetical protein